MHADSSEIRFLADPHASFTNALDLAFDATAIFGQPRSKRYALTVKDGKIEEVFVGKRDVYPTVSVTQADSSSS